MFRLISNENWWTRPNIYLLIKPQIYISLEYIDWICKQIGNNYSKYNESPQKRQYNIWLMYLIGYFRILALAILAGHIYPTIGHWYFKRYFL